MTSLIYRNPVKRLEDHLWYPILVKVGGGHKIVEMQGKKVNEWNDMVAEQERNSRKDFSIY